MYNTLFLIGLLLMVVKGKGMRAARWFPAQLNLPPSKGSTVWIHAVSVGEIQGMVPLVNWLKEQQTNATMIVSSVTQTGHAAAKKFLPCADAHIYLPYDLSWIVKPFVRKVRPTLVILAETDFWPHFLQSCKEVGAEVIVVNGKISEKSAARLAQFSRLTMKALENVDHYCVQNQTYKERFIKAGVPPGKLTITGNMKLINRPKEMSEEEVREWQERLGIKQGDFVITAGSTHDPEEEWIVEALAKKKCQLLLVPRHPERFDEVAKLLESKGIPYSRFSSGKVCKESVVLIDAMGELLKCYQISDLAIVGGSWANRVGGHNIIEPSYFGVPVVFGPFMQTQTDLQEYVLAADAGMEVEIEQLKIRLPELIEDRERLLQVGQNGLKLTESFCAGKKSPLIQTIECVISLR